MQGQVRTVGIAWYARLATPRILEVMEDADDLHETYDRWLRNAEAIERQLTKQGLTVVRARIEPGPFVAWCEAEGLPCNAKARSRWSSDFAHRALPDGDPG